MEMKAFISNLIEQKRDKIIKLSDYIWDNPEIHFEEYKSMEYLRSSLKSEEFLVEGNAAGLETAFVASYGNGKPVIAVLGEFDALTGLSQKKGVAEHNPVVDGGNGHGCGHNLLGAGSFAAAVAIKDYMKQTGLQGTIRYYGCPAEESGGGKAIMARAGVFDDIDIALSWHPSSIPSIWNISSLAIYCITYQFKGISSHAAISPHLGRSALDAVELMNVGVNYLREHIIPEARVHYAITNTGGVSPNVVQSNAEVVYYIRAPKKQQAEEILNRINNIAKGAALMTGTKMNHTIEGSVSNLIPNTTLANVMYDNLSAMQIPSYDEFDQKFAKEIQSTFSAEDIDAVLAEVGIETSKLLKDKHIADVVKPLGEEIVMPVSTDVGDVSWVVPTMQCTTACFALGTPLHTWQLVTQGTMPLAHKGMLHAAKVIAKTAIDIMHNPDIVEKAKNEWKERMDRERII